MKADLMTDLTGLTRFTRGSIAGRQERLPAPLRELHRTVLRRFLTTGAPPTARWLRQAAAETGLDATAVDALAAADAVHVVNGVVAVAYPFSGTPTPHRVELDGTPAVYAMCAIDALGLPAMTGRRPPRRAARRGHGPRRRLDLDAGQRGRHHRPRHRLRHRLRLLGIDVPEHHLPRQPRHRPGLSHQPPGPISPATATSTRRSSTRAPPSNAAATTSARCSEATPDDAGPDRILRRSARLRRARGG